MEQSQPQMAAGFFGLKGKKPSYSVQLLLLCCSFVQAVPYLYDCHSHINVDVDLNASSCVFLHVTHDFVIAKYFTLLVPLVLAGRVALHQINDDVLIRYAVVSSQCYFRDQVFKNNMLPG